MGNNENNNSKALKAGLWYTMSSVTVKAINIITTPIFTRMMTSDDYGIAQTFTSWYTLLTIFCSLNLTYSIGRAKLDFKGQLEKYVGSMQLLALSATLIIDTIMIVFIVPVSDFMELNPTLVVILAIYLLFAPIISLTQNKFKYQYRYKGNIAITAYTTLVSVSLTLFLMLFIKNERYYAKVLGSVITCAALSMAFWIISIVKKRVSINLEYWKYGLAISVPLILHSISLNVLSQSDRIMITKFVGTTATAVYSLAYSYAILINIVLGSVNEAWLPWFHDTFYAGGEAQIKKNVKPLVALGCIMGIGCIAIAPEAIFILGPEEYQMGKWAVGPVALGVICQFIYQQYVHIELHMKKTKFISAGTVIAAALNIVLNLIFIPMYGYLAAAYTTMTCYFVLMFVHLFITRVLLKVHLYDDFFMFAALFVTASIATAFMLLFDYIVVRYILLVVILLIYALTNKNMIIGLINKRKKKN